MENIIFKLRESIDVYKIGEDILYFYFINSRQGINVSIEEVAIELIAGIDGKRTINEILKIIKMEYSEELEKFLKFLLEKKIIYILNKEKRSNLLLEEEERYSRQLIFFQEFFEMDSYEFQNKLFNEKILIFGVGAIGAGMAIELAMMGIKKFILVDKGKISEKSINRHYYFKRKYLNISKVDALKDYILEIDTSIEIEKFSDTINYNTDLEKYFDLKPTFVINTLDEPYIGITSLKIGRETYLRKLPLYVGGGFDAHLMSTGELIIPDLTPCVDCYITHFTTSLKNWQPEYNTKIVDKKDEIYEVGGLASMSLFSISYGVIEILKYLADHTYKGFGRGELLFEELKIKYLKIEKNKNCLICGDKNDI